ncbi:hypothetical protein, partial [Methanosarcina mazei]
MPVSLKFLHFQKRADFSVHESGFGKEKGNIFRAYFFVKGKRIPDRAVGLLENQTAGGHPTLKDGVCFGPPARLLG